MKRPTPIIIPAKDEEENLSVLIPELQRELGDSIRIILAENNSSDNTRSLAKKFNIEIVPPYKIGKLDALLGALRMLGDDALEPFILMDGDTRPKNIKGWFIAMTRPLENSDRPMAITGRVLFTEPETNRINLPWSGWRFIQALTRNIFFGRKSDRGPYLGPNQSLYIKSPKLLKGILDLPNNIWPMEECTIAWQFGPNGGRNKYLLAGDSVVYNPKTHKRIVGTTGGFSKEYQRELRNDIKWIDGLTFVREHPKIYKK